MKINMHILADEFSGEIASSSIRDDFGLFIEGPRLLIPGDCNYSDNYVYITTLQSFEHSKVSWGGGFPRNLLLITAVPYEVTCPADTDYITVISDEDPYQFFNRVQEIFFRYSRWEENIVESYLLQKPLMNIIDLYSRMMPNPLVLCDKSGFVLHTSSNVPFPPTGFWKVVLPHGYYDMNRHIKDNPDSSFDFYNVILHEEPVMVTDLDYPIIIANIFIGGIRAGDITTAATYAPITKGQYSLMQFFQQSLQQYISSKGIAFMMNPNSNIIVSQVLKGEKVSPLLLGELFDKQSWKINDEYYVIKVRVRENPVIRNTELGYCSMLLSNEFPESLIVEDSHTLSIVMPGNLYHHPRSVSENSFGISGAVDEDSAQRNKAESTSTVDVLSVIRELVSLVSVKCVISMLYRGFSNISFAGRQCDLALSYLEDNASSEVLFFEDIYQEAFTGEFPSSTFKLAFCLPEIIRLSEFDQAGDTDLVATLYEVLRTGLRYNEAADKLHIHRNTLTYRLKRITDLTGINLNCYEYIDRLLLSCMLVM